MHIIIAAITAIAGLIWALNSLQRAGFDLNSLNPFYWARRRAWEKKQINPLYAIETPREATALLMFAALREGGDPTSEEKEKLLALYESQLRFSEKEAREMYVLASHLLSTDPNFQHKIADILAPSLPQSTQEQRESIPQLVRQAGELSEPANEAQRSLQQAVERCLAGYRPK